MKAECVVVTRAALWFEAVVEALAPYRVVRCRNLVEALHLNAACRLVALDAGDVEDIPAAVEQLRLAHPQVKVVVATLSPAWRPARAALLAGATDYVRRSGDVSYLRARWAALLAPASGTVHSAAEDCHMASGRLLAIDNDGDGLRTMSARLSAEGYEVLTATSAAAGRDILEREHVDLVILDIRLVDDEEPKDYSGIHFARDNCNSVPTIMLTRYPHATSVLAALRPALDGLTSVVDYVAKDDELQALVDAVRRQLRRRVFIVHGRDDEAKERVARFVDRLMLKSIILHEQPGAGRAIIEKFEDYANVGFALVLLTPDDVGGLRTKGKAQLKPRARQNVVFELGYFVGKLGRRRVGVLYKEGVEIPSDYDGVSYIPMGAGDGWKVPLAQHMKQAGLTVDLNRVVTA